MLDTYLQNQLHDDEKIIAVVRRSALAHIRAWIFSVVIIIAGFFFMVPLLQRGRWGLFGFLLLLLVGTFSVIRTAVVNRMNVLVLTSTRVIDIDQQGMFHRVVSECQYDNIQEMTFQIRGVLGTSFHIGTLMIHTAGDRADIAAEGIKHPQKIQELISKIQRKREDGKKDGELTAQELVKMLEQIRSHIDIPVEKNKESLLDKHDKNRKGGRK